MKTFFFAILFSLASLSPVHATGSVADLVAQINKITHQAAHEFGIQVNLSGRQRMLTQKMTKETLLISLDIARQENRKNLAKTIALFDKTLRGLKNGDKAVGLIATTSPEILAQLAKVSNLWKGFRPLVDKVVAGDIGKTTLNQIAIANIPLLAEMNTAVGMYAKISGTDLADLATVINLSGKQRMLTQKMAKELLLIAAGINRKQNKAQLTKTVALFDRTLKGLLDGDKGLKLPGTKGQKIRTQLAKVNQLWQTFKPVIASQNTSPSALKTIAKLNLPLLAEMNRAVKMYEDQSKK